MYYKYHIVHAGGESQKIVYREKCSSEFGYILVTLLFGVLHVACGE